MRILTLCILLCTALVVFCQTTDTLSGGALYNLNIENGYGSGTYEEGDTVYVFAGEQDGKKIFTGWEGDIEFMDLPNEYISRVIIPDHDIGLHAIIHELDPSQSMITITIQGAENPKSVTLYLPPKDQQRGVMWLYHGTNGFGINWKLQPEMWNFCKYLMYHDYAIIATDCEEQTLDMDLNGDGVYRYSYGIDSTLIDQANIRAIRDTLVKRDFLSTSIPYYVGGFSAGGAFAEFVGNTFRWKAIVNQSASGNEMLSELAPTPYFHVMNEHDNHPNVGQQGVMDGITYAQNYADRNACLYFDIYKNVPLYPERFAKDGYMSVDTSRLIFQEIKGNGGLDSHDKLLVNPTIISAAIIAHPQNFPVITSLSAKNFSYFMDQLGATFGYHQFLSNYNGRTVGFIESVCGTTGVKETQSPVNMLLDISPNPTDGIVRLLHGPTQYSVFDTQGRPVLQGFGELIDLGDMPSGLYIIHSGGRVAKIVRN